MAQTFGQLPSAYLRSLLGPDLPPYVTAADWYAFDVAAADRYFYLQRQAQGDPAKPSPKPRPLRRADEAIQRGIVGTEVPPWER